MAELHPASMCFTLLPFFYWIFGAVASFDTAERIVVYRAKEAQFSACFSLPLRRNGNMANTETGQH